MNRSPARLRVAVVQTAPVLGDIAANVDVLADVGDADLVVTPELSLTGYDLRDTVHEIALHLDAGEAPPEPLAGLGRRGAPAIVAGLVERGRDGVPRNTAVLIEDGVVRHVHRKIYLPTYGLFDEGRWFGRGQAVEVFPFRGWRCALLICEDFWHPSLVYLAAMGGADILIVPAAAPGRGVLDATEGDVFASSAAWRELARVSARTHGMYIVLANSAGVEGGVTFAGGSLIVAPDGTPLAAAPEGGVARIDAVIDPAERDRARRPYAHIRDEDPRFFASALSQLARPQ